MSLLQNMFVLEIAQLLWLSRGKEGHEFLISTEHKTVEKWEFDNKYLYKTYKLQGHADSVRDVAADKAEGRGISACADHSLRLWNLEDQNPLAILVGHEGLVVSRL